jgi:Protein of unknown function (DUF3616)
MWTAEQSEKIIQPQRSATVSLQFSDGPGDWRTAAKDIASSVSAIVHTNDTMWVVSDQTATVERLSTTRHGSTTFENHRSFRLNDFVDLPDHDDTEVDLEGIDVYWLNRDTGYLWVVGSHSWARGQVKNESTEGAIEALRSVALDRNRQVLVRIPIVLPENGLPELVQSCPHPTRRGHIMTAAVLTGLAAVMAVDDHLSAFAATPGGKASIPGKDNGVDIEGLAVLAEDRVLVGLRGPVLRGWAMVLDLRIKASKEHTSGRIKMKGNPRALSKHFLDLGGPRHPRAPRGP